MLPWIFKFALRDLCIIPFPQREFSPDSNSVFEINGTNLRRIWGWGIWIISYLCQRTSAIPCFGKDTDFPWKEPILLTFFTEGQRNCFQCRNDSPLHDSVSLFDDCDILTKRQMYKERVEQSFRFVIKYMVLLLFIALNAERSPVLSSVKGERASVIML